MVTATARQAMAREKARITGKRARQPCALEQAAAEREKQREARARKAEAERPFDPAQDRLGISRQVEPFPLSLPRVSLPADGIEPPEDELGWKPYNPEQAKGEKKKTGTIVTGRVNMAGVCALSRRLMAIERARALGRVPADRRTWALEQAGRRWAEEKTRRK